MFFDFEFVDFHINFCHNTRMQKTKQNIEVML